MSTIFSAHQRVHGTFCIYAYMLLRCRVQTNWNCNQIATKFPTKRTFDFLRRLCTVPKKEQI